MNQSNIRKAMVLSAIGMIVGMGCENSKTKDAEILARENQVSEREKNVSNLEERAAKVKALEEKLASVEKAQNEKASQLDAVECDLSEKSESLNEKSNSLADVECQLNDREEVLNQVQAALAKAQNDLEVATELAQSEVLASDNRLKVFSTVAAGTPVPLMLIISGQDVGEWAGIALKINELNQKFGANYLPQTPSHLTGTSTVFQRRVVLADAEGFEQIRTLVDNSKLAMRAVHIQEIVMDGYISFVRRDGNSYAITAIDEKGNVTKSPGLIQIFKDATVSIDDAKTLASFPFLSAVDSMTFQNASHAVAGTTPANHSDLSSAAWNDILSSGLIDASVRQQLKNILNNEIVQRERHAKNDGGIFGGLDENDKLMNIKLHVRMWVKVNGRSKSIDMDSPRFLKSRVNPNPYGVEYIFSTDKENMYLLPVSSTVEVPASVRPNEKDVGVTRFIAYLVNLFDVLAK